MDEASCVCKPCERNIKRNINDYVPRWKSKMIYHCIIPQCTATNTNNTIIHSSSFTIQRISTLFNITIPSDDHNKLIPLCDTHYKQVHRLLHANMYTHNKCTTCRQYIKGPIRHCPDPQTIKVHFSIHGDIEMNIRSRDDICTNCYNAHLSIIQNKDVISHDHDLDQQVNSVGAEREIDNTMKCVITAVGTILKKKLAVLLTDTYNLFMKEATKDASESEIREEVPKRCLLNRLIAFFGHHLMYSCTVKSMGIVLYRRGTDLITCLTKTLKLVQGTGISFIHLATQDICTTPPR